jgi:putative dimethyl sulfoxide reductase chaperone
MEMEQHLQLVGDSFRLLSACFYEPEKQMFLEENLCLNLSDLLKPLDLLASTDSQKMQNALLESDEKALIIDHAALFIGPFELSAPPYGSVYLDAENQVMGESTIRVRRIYEEANLRINQKEPADHIAIELEFMSYLFGLEINANQKSNKKEQSRLQLLQKSFFQEYLNPWIPDLCQKIETNAETEFYKLLASVLRQFSNEMTNLFEQRTDELS